MRLKPSPRCKREESCHRKDTRKESQMAKVEWQKSKLSILVTFSLRLRAVDFLLKSLSLLVFLWALVSRARLCTARHGRRDFTNYRDGAGRAGSECTHIQSENRRDSLCRARHCQPR